MKLTLLDITESLGLPSTTIDRWIRQGRIPLKKKNEFYHCKRNVFERWAKKHGVNFDFSSEAQAHQDEESQDCLLSAMKAGGVFYSVEGDCVSEVLKNAVKHVPGFSEEDQTELFEKLMEREGLNSTGIGNHVAIPHPRTPLTRLVKSPMIVTCFLKTPVYYSSVDDLDVTVLFIILCPTTQLHLQILSKLSFCIRDKSFFNFIQSDADKGEHETFFEIIERLEEKLESR
jgi:PTS system nitrogen regulatory IIA component